MKKKLLSLIVSVLTLCMLFSLAACNLKPQDTPPAGADNNEPDKLAYVSLDINPAIELIVDKDNNVVSVRGENEDGQVLLYEEIGIKGEKIDVAINKITDLAIKYGYLDANNKVVDTIVNSGDTSFASEILNKVNTSITATAENLGLSVTTDGQGAYSLLRKMNEYKAQFPNNEAIQNMSVSKFKLALSVSETGEISLDAAVKLDDAKLIQMLNDISPKIESFATATYLEAKTKALAIYEQATEIAGYSVYTSYYLENMFSHPMTAYYGGVYQMYASAAKGFGVICDVAELSAQIDKYPLNETQIESIVTALGMDSADALKNSKGEITIESIEAYADKLFKNTPISNTLEQTKTALTTAILDIENIFKEKMNNLTSDYIEKIETALNSAKQIAATVENLINSLPEGILTFFNDCTSDLKVILNEMENILNNGTINLEKLKELTSRLDSKAQTYLNKIKADLSQEEFAELEARRKAEIAKMSEQKEIFDNALDEAAKEAKAYLSQLKSERLPNN